MVIFECLGSSPVVGAIILFGTIDLNGFELTFKSAGIDSYFSIWSTISGNGKLNFDSSEDTIYLLVPKLLGPNTYTGQTNVLSGNLFAGSSTVFAAPSFGSSSILIASLAKLYLDFYQTTTLSNAITIEGQNSIDPTANLLVGGFNTEEAINVSLPNVDMLEKTAMGAFYYEPHTSPNELGFTVDLAGIESNNFCAKYYNIQLEVPSSLYVNQGESTAFSNGPSVSCTLTEQQITYHQLSYTAGSNGSISGDTSQTVADGEDGTTVTAVASNGYIFDKWSDDKTEAARTDLNVLSDISVTAYFKLIPEEEPVDEKPDDEDIVIKEEDKDKEDKDKELDAPDTATKLLMADPLSIMLAGLITSAGLVLAIKRQL